VKTAFPLPTGAALSAAVAALGRLGPAAAAAHILGPATASNSNIFPVTFPETCAGWSGNVPLCGTWYHTSTMWSESHFLVFFKITNEQGSGGVGGA
jgi:hypothetical protein